MPQLVRIFIRYRNTSARLKPTSKSIDVILAAASHDCTPWTSSALAVLLQCKSVSVTDNVLFPSDSCYNCVGVVSVQRLSGRE